MKIGLISYDMQDFGGLEEYVTNLAVGLQAQGHEVNVLSFAWVPEENQYRWRLRSRNIRLIQPPEWVSRAASDWTTKEKVLRILVMILSPLLLPLAVILSVIKGRSLSQAWNSSKNWLRGQIMERLLGPDRRKWVGRILLGWWRLTWHPDILHVHGFTSSLMFVIEWAHARKIPVIYQEHATPNAELNLWKDSQASINKATKVVAVSEASADALRRVCGVPEPIVVKGPPLPDPFDSEWYPKSDQPRGQDCIRITTIARLFPMKGLDFLLEAAAIVKHTHPLTQFKIHGEGELRSNLMEKAQRLGLDERSIFMGAFAGQEELARIMAQTDIFVLSSILEGQPLVILEAMAYGLPIVATRVGGIPELIENGVNGLLCSPADAEALAGNIRLLIENPELRARLGGAARASYEGGSFQINTISSHFASMYQDALGEKG